MSYASIPIRVAGDDEDLEVGGLGAEDVEDAFLADGVGVHQDVVEDEDLRFVGREFLRDGQAEVEEELILGALGQVFEGVVAGDEEGISLVLHGEVERAFQRGETGFAEAGGFGAELGKAGAELPVGGVDNPEHRGETLSVSTAKMLMIYRVFYT